MEKMTEFLQNLNENGLIPGNFLGLLHILIGRKIQLKDGTLISSGITWRQLAELMKQLRLNPQLVEELNIDGSILPPRDRHRYWYQAISLAKIDSQKARDEADRVAKILKKSGFLVS